MADDLGQTYQAPPVEYRYLDNEFRPMEFAAVAEIMQHWFGPHLPGVVPPAWNQYPDDYLVIDLETTGGSFTKDLIVDVGWAIVRGRKIVDQGGVMINWRGHPAVDWSWVVEQMDKTAYHMGQSGRRYCYTPHLLEQHGQEPTYVLGQFAALLDEAIQRQEFIVGHNAYRFERGMLDGNLHRFLNGYKLRWHPNAVFDTGLVEKAAQQGRLPWLGDTLDKWSTRAAAPPWNVKWSLEEHCIPKYRICERYGIDRAGSHTAEGDCPPCHFLFETYRDISEGTYVDMPSGTP